jgi:hypothetical protein
VNTSEVSFTRRINCAPRDARSSTTALPIPDVPPCRFFSACKQIEKGREGEETYCYNDDLAVQNPFFIVLCAIEVKPEDDYQYKPRDKFDRKWEKWDRLDSIVVDLAENIERHCEVGKQICKGLMNKSRALSRLPRQTSSLRINHNKSPKS